jgi:hypothetical protein
MGDEGRDLALARDALRFYRDDDLHYDDWLEILMALRQFGDAGRTLCHRWSGQSGKYDPIDLDRRWESLGGGDEEPGGERSFVTVATLFKHARDAGWPGPAALGLRYPVDYRGGRGPVIVVQGDAAFAALDDAGHVAIGLPAGQPCLDKVARLLGDDARELVVVGSREPPFDPEPVARVLERILGRTIKVAWPPGPFKDVATWIAALDNTDRNVKGG